MVELITSIEETIVDVLAGNGPKEIDIREVIEREGTEDRVALGKLSSHQTICFIACHSVFRRTGSSRSNAKFSQQRTHLFEYVVN